MCSTDSSATGAGSSTSRASPTRPARGLSRRALLASTALAGAVGVASCMGPLLGADEAPPAGRGEPFADGSWFDDGFGWVE